MVRSSQHSLGLCELVLLNYLGTWPVRSLPNQALSHSPLITPSDGAAAAER
jgi:hypothetical protein